MWLSRQKESSVTMTKDSLHLVCDVMSSCSCPNDKVRVYSPLEEDTASEGNKRRSQINAYRWQLLLTVGKSKEPMGQCNYWDLSVRILSFFFGWQTRMKRSCSQVPNPSNKLFFLISLLFAVARSFFRPLLSMKMLCLVSFPATRQH